MDRRTIFIIVILGLFGIALAVFADRVQFFQGKAERSEIENRSANEDADRSLPTVEEVDAAQLDVSLSDIFSQDSEKAAVAYKANYVQVSIVSGEEAARGNIQIVQKGEKRKIGMTFPYVSRTVYYLDKVYLCSETRCNVVSPTHVSAGQPFAAFSSLADQPDQIEGSGVQRTRVVKAAGLLAQCFAFERPGPTHIEACYTPDGIPLLFKTELGADGETATTVIIASSVSRDVADSEFELPN